MAEAIPFGIAEKILMKLGSSAFEHLALISGIKDEVRKLCNTLTTIRAVLVDADEQQEKSFLVRNWIKNLKDVVYDIDDILDEFSTKASKSEPDFAARMKTQVSQLFSSSNQVVFRYKIGKRIRNVTERLDEMASDMAKFSFTERYDQVRIRSRDREKTHSFVLATNVAGREEDKEELVKLLISPSEEECVSALAIIGIGGLGKTTLAKLVYNDERIVETFELRTWISVADEFKVESILEKILSSSGDLEMDAEHQGLLDEIEIERLQILVRRKLDGKRYLLVMDDVWSETREIWIQLSELLFGGAEGSKIVATTRSQKVAFAMDAECMFMLQRLPEDASWSLFKQLAFRKGHEDKYPNLMKIGESIVKKCYGVPLVIRTLGSMLRSTKEEKEWLLVQKNEIWEHHDIMKILKLSYDQLPSDLKQCFTYCSLFPKGYEFEIQGLIQLWMAQGFISQSEMGKQLEETGIQYVEELTLGSFFEDVKRDDNQNVTSCKMHDLMHDLACSIAKPELCVAEADGRDISGRVQHVSFGTYLPFSWTLPPSLLKVKKVRTLMFPLQYQMGCRISDEEIFASLMRLRVLDLHNQRIEKLSRAIGELIHLRYLDLSKNVMTSLPRSIGKLQNLQTLKLERCYKLEKLPVEISRIVTLRYLENSKCNKLNHMPQGFGKLTSLRTLPRFVLGKSSSISKCGGLGELKYLNNLRGELSIINLENVNDIRESENANLKDKEYLYSLRLSWCREADHGQECEEDAAILESLQPHMNLRQLHISGYGAIKFSTWMNTENISLLPNLVTITIERCFRSEELPSFAELPGLKVLKLFSLNELTSIYRNSNSSSSTYYPALKELVLFDLPLLRDWPKPEEKVQPSLMKKTECFPCLTKLMITDCPNLLSLPCPSSLEELVIHNTADKLQSSLTNNVQAAYFQCS
ncbi:OLC1v1038050C1 [Oldenlandia corymbosa var. corymbosa]|uniref:OLC1v1038050C1 n=1 Tax=Oldenlandia corymbosa var. corymbosa TaxID=529605 RepID=A0AAV1CZJ3_OLDCO|nr:OLC1v1038050C1 [Oldenlandia corymbosa var. corymbosa]